MYERQLPLGRYGDHTAGICGAGLRYRFLRASRLVLAIFTFAGFSVLPTARNNRTSIMQNDAQAQEKMQAYLADYLNFPLPARYAHPVVLRRMQRAVMDGRAVTAAQALDVVKADLKALNADVTVSQEEYDEVVAIKSMFLNAEYQ